MRKEIFCVSEPESCSAHLSLFTPLSAAGKKAEVSQAGASAVNGCINKSISGAQTTTAMFLTDSKQEFHLSFGQHMEIILIGYS